MKPSQDHHKQLKHLTNTQLAACRHCVKLQLAHSWNHYQVVPNTAINRQSRCPKLVQAWDAQATTQCFWGQHTGSTTAINLSDLYWYTTCRDRSCWLALPATAPGQDRASRSVLGPRWRGCLQPGEAVWPCATALFSLIAGAVTAQKTASGGKLNRCVFCIHNTTPKQQQKASNSQRSFYGSKQSNNTQSRLTWHK